MRACAPCPAIVLSGEGWAIVKATQRGEGWAIVHVLETEAVDRGYGVSDEPELRRELDEFREMPREARPL